MTRAGAARLAAGAAALLLSLCPARPVRAEEGGGLPEEALARVRQATVLVEAYYREVLPTGRLADEEVGPATGTGLVVSEDGLIITNRHVVDPLHVQEPREVAAPAERARRGRHFRLSSLKVRLHSGTPRSRSFDAQVLRTCDDPDDLALLRIRTRAPLVAFPVADALHDAARAPSLRETQRVWAAGFPLGHAVEEALGSVDLARNPHGLELSIREGSVAALRRGERDRLNAIEHTCAVDHGNSGGPLVDARGTVVGINTWGHGKVGYAIPIEAVRRAFPETLRTLGATTVEGASPRGRTLVVEPAGEPTETTFDDLVTALEASRPGDVVELPEGEVDFSVHDWVGEKHVPRGVWVRGAGAGRTRLRMGDNRLWIGTAEGSYVELSDLTLVPGFDWPELGIPYGAGPETYVHDVRWEGVLLGDRSSPSLVGCGMKDLRVDEGATPRLERCDVMRAIVDGEGSAPRLRGCGLGGLEVTDRASPILYGCSLDPVAHRGFPGPPVIVREASATFERCTLQGPWNSGQILRAGRGARVRLVGNRFRSDGVHGIVIEVGGSAELVANALEPGGGAAVMVSGNAILDGNCIRYAGYRGPPVAPPPFAPPDWDPVDSWPAYGVVLEGAAARVRSRQNLFISTSGSAAAISSQGGAPQVTDEGGDEVRVESPGAR